MRTFLSIALGLGLTVLPSVMLPSVAFADGLIIKREALSQEVRTNLEADITTARTAVKAVRERVRNVEGVKPEVYGKRRNPVPEATRELEGLGKDALLPMLEALAFDASQPGLSSAEKEALTVGMLSAVGTLRDQRSTPVLRAALESQATASPVAFAAARALGKLCGKTERDALKAQLGEGSALRLAAIFGLAECRSQSTVGLLAPVARGSNAAARKEAVKALGTVGAAWAWATMGEDKQAEGLAVRNASAASLIDAFVANEDVRTDAKRALLMCESTTALTKVRELKAATADAALSKALGDLEKALERQAKRLAKKG